MTVVSFLGQARSGKGTCAGYTIDYLKQHGEHAYEYAFADPLKSFLKEITGFEEKHVNGYLKERDVDVQIHMDTAKVVIRKYFRRYYDGDITRLYDAFKRVLDENFIVNMSWLSPFVLFKASPRKMMQLIGTEFARKYIRDSIWLDMANDKLENTQGVMVIPDVRFANEVDWCKARGIVVGIQRDTADYNVFSDHDSERYVWDLMCLTDDCIMNYGGLDSLREETESVVFALQAGHYDYRGCGK